MLVLAKGFTLGLSMILPIGAQNSMILNHGINRNYHLTTAALFALYDVVLIGLGVMGSGLLMSSGDLMFSLLTWGGIAFLLVYGAMSMKTALNSHANNDDQAINKKSLKFILITSLIVTFLNPHVYIDTVMVLGSVGGQYQGSAKIYFMVGAMAASVVWFFCLATGAAKLSGYLSQPKIKRIIDLVIALVMWAIAYSLFDSWFSKFYG
jgi:L-lysine exporter family protein LysE/ArgO